MNNIVKVIVYKNNEFSEIKECKIQELINFNNEENYFLWIIVDGYDNYEDKKNIGKIFNIHDVVIEDLISIEQRPKIEDYGEYIHIALKDLYYGEKSEDILVSQINIILGHNFIISFHENDLKSYMNIIKKINFKKNIKKEYTPDYLAYYIIDKIVDNYFSVLEDIEEQIEEVEDRLLDDATNKELQDIKIFRKKILFLRKSIWPLREAIDRLEDINSYLIQENNYIYFKDIKDHLISVIYTLEIFRETTAEMIAIHLSITSNKMNLVMKALAVVSIIFMPLTLIAGIYGMNFKYIPELDLRYGYFAAIGVMIIIGISLVFYFKKRGWI